MKNILINNPKVTRDENSTIRMLRALKSRFKESELWVDGAEVLSDIQYTVNGDIAKKEQERSLKALIDYVVFIGDYFNLIVSDNIAATTRKKGPYNIFVSLTLDTAFSKARLHYYLDGDIFGLIAGSGYTNIVNLIRVSFPIYSKIGSDVELKVYSLSEQQETSIY